MLLALIALGVLNLILVIVLLTRKQDGNGAELIALRAKLDEFGARLQSGVEQVRRDAGEQAQQGRAESSDAASKLRNEVIQNIAALGTTQQTALHGMGEKIDLFKTEMQTQQEQARTVLQRSLGELRDKQSEHLEKLSRDNSAKLDEMRRTVDEKLEKTLNERLTQSFGQVTTHLGEVQKGLGEMKELATGVNDLKRVFSNVKTRGGVGEFILGELMAQIFAPDQYIKNARVKAGTLEQVEYALKVPTASGETTLLAIDSKFPQADWERLEHAYENGSAEEIAAARKNLERAVRTQGESICKKYVHEPDTLPYAVMFLPTEGLYAEVLRLPGLVTSLQQDCQVMVVGPATFMHIMANFRMAFRTMAIQAKGGDVLKVLGNAKREFETFGGLIGKVQDQVSTVQNTLEKLRSKTTTINRTLKTVDSEVVEISSGAQASLREMENVAPLLAATGEDDF